MKLLDSIKEEKGQAEVVKSQDPGQIDMASDCSLLLPDLGPEVELGDIARWVFIILQYGRMGVAQF